ncbi:MAG: hypothetical protein ACOYBG_06825 [Eubacteriales bacterium]|jgi:hypothetical protein
MDFKFVYVNGHVEVLDNKGRFLFSADTETEARYEIMQHYVERSA